MADAPTYADLFDAGEREILIRPTSFDAAIVRVDGSDVNIAMHFSATMAHEVAVFAQKAANEMFLGTAERSGDEALERWVYDRRELIKNGARSAAVYLTFNRTNTTPGFTYPADAIVSTATGVNFKLANDLVFASGVTGPLLVLAYCEQTGRQGNVAAGTITTLVTPPEDDTLTVTNTEPAAGGRDAETSGELAARARDFFASARRGTLEAIENGGRAGGAEQVSAIENIDPTSLVANFRTQLVIADADGQANAALADEVRRTLVEYRCLGVPVLVIAGAPEFVTIRVNGLQFQAGVNTSTVLDEARLAILSTVGALVPGQTLERAAIFAALKSVDGLIVPADAIEEPLGDLVPSSGGVLRTSKDRIILNEAA